MTALSACSVHHAHHPPYRELDSSYQTRPGCHTRLFRFFAWLTDYHLVLDLQGHPLEADLATEELLGKGESQEKGTQLT